jgi:uncharacterized protein YcnI
MKLSPALLSLALILPGAASAHVVLTAPEGVAGSYYVGALRVGHGCDGAATTVLKVEIPVDTPNAKPQPKPGWTVAIEKTHLAQPVRGEGSSMISDRVSAITWRGKLSDAEFDEFGLRLQLPDREAVLALPVTQTCEKGEARWNDADPGHPSPKLTVKKAAADPASAHAHH